jgi:DNA-binding CsgD family transcriptional regulator
MRLSHREYDQTLDLVAQAASADGEQPFEEPVIERALRLVPADHAGYFEFSGPRNHRFDNDFFVQQPSDAPGFDSLSDSALDTLDSWPLMDAKVGGSTIPLKLSDFLTNAELSRNPWHQAVLRPAGIRFEMKLWLPAPCGTVRGFFFVRDATHRDFTEQERSILALLRPHLSSIRERWQRRHRPPLITARETEILQLVAKGMTNSEVATRLVISRATVRTHLEHIYDKLDVHTRAAAVAWLKDIGRVN